MTLIGNWELPTNGTPGTIQNIIKGDNGYLSTMGKIEAWSEVKEVALDVNDVGQQWERSKPDDSGYFTLKSPKSGKFLTGHKQTLTIEGNISSYIPYLRLL